MSWQIVGDNRKAQIEADATFDDGGLLIAEPAEGFCNTRLLFFKQLDNPLNPTGIFADIYDTAQVPDLGDNKYAFKWFAGLYYHIEDILIFKYGDVLEIDHAPDPDGKRYFEGWITFPPTSAYSMTYDSGTDIIGGSNYCELIPTPSPDVQQSISFPAAVGGSHVLFLVASEYGGIRCETDYLTIAMWGGSKAIIWDYVGGTYVESYTWDHANCTAVYGIATKNGKCVISYYDSVAGKVQLAYIEKDGTWSHVSTHDNPGSFSGPINLAESGGQTYIIIGGVKQYAKSYKYSDRTLVWDSVNTSGAGDFDPIHEGYFSSDHYAWATDWAPWGSGLYRPSFKKMFYNYMDIDNETYLYGSTIVDQPGYGVITYGPVYLYHRESDPDHAWLHRTHLDQIWPYEFLDNDLGLIRPHASITDAYVYDRFIVGFGGLTTPTGQGVWYIQEADDGPIRLGAYAYATHKKFPGAFYPVADRQYLCNNQDGTMKLLRIGKHYTLNSPGTAILKATAPNAIAALSDFEFPTIPAGTDIDFTLSWDGVNYYAYTSSWIPMSDPAGGSNLSNFKVGCQAGFPSIPADTYDVYIRMYITSTDDDVSPEIYYTDVKISLTTLSTDNNAYLCDDSQLEVEHVSPTKTTVKSKIQQNVILAVKLNILAPPYDVDYEG